MDYIFLVKSFKTFDYVLEEQNRLLLGEIILVFGSQI